jgi:dihydropteroate synthase
MVKSKYKFFKQTEKITETIKSSHDPIKEWRPDPKGYFLIRVNEKKKRIEAGLCTYKHIITKMVHGRNAIEIYNTIVRKNLISRLEHAAYLGKELYKAELALKYGKKYRQEFPLEFSDKVKMKLKDS